MKHRRSSDELRLQPTEGSHLHPARGEKRDASCCRLPDEAAAAAAAETRRTKHFPGFRGSEQEHIPVVGRVRRVRRVKWVMGSQFISPLTASVRQVGFSCRETIPEPKYVPKSCSGIG